MAGVLVLCLIGAAFLVYGLPMISGSGSSPAAASPAALPGLPGPAAGPAVTTTTAGGTPAVSFLPGPTDVPPANLLVTFQAERDPITGEVTITYTGGARYAVKDVSIRLTRSDGIVDTRTVTLTETGTIATLQGTRTGDDRIEVTANYFNGDHYRIIDSLLEYKKRDW